MNASKQEDYVIDVLRAFKTAAYCFAAGAKEIVLVASVEEAFNLRQEDQAYILMGEQEGIPIQGFHYGNSPADMLRSSLTGQKIVQRTSAGTQGVVACRHADQLLLASFVVMDATLKYIEKLSPKDVSFIVTGSHNGDEDLACAEYAIERLCKRSVQIKPFSFAMEVEKRDGCLVAKKVMP